MVNALIVISYALMSVGTTLYTETLTPIVTLPPTYFIGIVDEAKTANGMYHVVYNDIDGYVYASEVEVVDYTPKYKYETTVTFTVNNDGQSANLRSEPNHLAASILTVLPSGASGYCYGEVIGTSLITAFGGLWYYVRIGDYRGYIYGAHATVTTTPENTIEAEVTIAPGTDDTEEVLPDTFAIILILLMCVPAVGVMYLIFKKRPTDNTNNT